jgi:hypothetical protein
MPMGGGSFAPQQMYTNKNNYSQSKGADPFGDIDKQQAKKIDIDVFGKKTPPPAAMAPPSN